MKERYVGLAELKKVDLVENERYLARLKLEYNDLDNVLNQLSK
jgi:hypothetical protein